MRSAIFVGEYISMTYECIVVGEWKSTRVSDPSEEDLLSQRGRCASLNRSAVTGGPGVCRGGGYGVRRT